MTKKSIEAELRLELNKCGDMHDVDGTLEYEHAPMSQGTYADGILFAIRLLQK